MKFQPVYRIGEAYKYPTHDDIFILKKVENDIYIFECGHRMFGSCFVDLIRIKTGVQVYQESQLRIF